MSEKDKRFENAVGAAASKFSDGAQAAIIHVVPSFKYCGNWGYIIQGKPGFSESIADLKTEPKNVALRRVRNGALIEVNPAFLAHNINGICAELKIDAPINSTFVAKFEERRAKEIKEFTKFIEKVASFDHACLEKSKNDPKMYNFTIGVYSRNESLKLRNNGVEYPAFKLSIDDAFAIMDGVAKKNENVTFMVKVKTAETMGYAEIFQAWSNSKGREAVLGAMEIAEESKNGILVEFRVLPKVKK